MHFLLGLPVNLLR